MSGKIDPIFLSVLIGVGGLCVFTDLKFGKIYNKVTLPVLVIGFFYSFFAPQGVGVFSSLTGIFLALISYGFLFALGWLGGGDVKLLMALSAWGGKDFALHTALLSILLGGFLAFFVLLFKGELISFLKRGFDFLKILIWKELAFEKPKINKSSRFPFALPLVLAALWVVWDSPIGRWF